MDYLFAAFNLGVLLWLGIGVAFHKRHSLHMMWMTSGFALDTALLLLIELDRGALEQTFTPMGMGFWLVVHILIATVLVFWYPMLIFSGGKVSAGKPKDFHRRIARIFFVLRFLLWVTAVLAMQEKGVG